ncbi:hypothetical protein NCC78_25150 [Micromonospora phytophila]|uniref:hypothetical protein n=1 Tax=Micromonospora phytophila TaxID=709888 RepID=UPI00202F6CBB|nr:hypothetical protein [Micromonospora phytophila]MCM0677938.1 hypothetical protein [Micromonospora phytophila]
MPDIEVDVAAVRRLGTAAEQAAAGLTGLGSAIAAAADVPPGAFGHLPFASDLLRDNYAEQVQGGAELFRAGHDAFRRVGATLGETADAYERNEQEIDQGFSTIGKGMGR